MNKKFFTLLAATCIFSVASTVMANEVVIPQNKLKQAGINVNRAHMGRFSSDNSFLYLYQSNPDLKRTREGFPVELFVLPIDGKNKVGDIKKYEISSPVSKIEGMTLTPDQKNVIIISKSGTSFVKLNLETGKQETILEHVEGQPGFRSNPQLIRVDNGEVFVQGYFYDSQNFAGVDCTTILDPSKKGVEAFKEVIRIEKTIDYDLRPLAYSFTSTKCAFGVLDDKKGKQSIFAWNPPEVNEPVTVDDGKKISDFWASGNRVAYSIQRADETYDLMIYDLKTKEKKTIASGTKTPYFNLALSEDASTLLFTDTEHRITRAKYFYADEASGWQMKPVVDFGDKTRPFGVTRISNNGGKVAVFNRKSLTIADVK
ncbi:hypothetical protein IJT10_08665 [bacterium]|nr:hypothetical protein [bacterium]